MGNSVAFGNEQALNLAAAELIKGNFGINARNATNSAGILPQAQPTWLHVIITKSPQWALGKTPGTNNGFWSMMQTAKQKANTYLLWSDSGEGYFSDKAWTGIWGVGAFTNSITRHEVAGWLQGHPLPVRLSPAEKNHAIISTIVALRATASRNVGSDCNIAWCNDPQSDTNKTRPPAVGLGHELIHAFYSCRGEQCGRDFGHFSTVLFEYQCVGLGPWDETALSENSLRREWAGLVPRIPVQDHLNRKIPNKRILYD